MTRRNRKPAAQEWTLREMRLLNVSRKRPPAKYWSPAELALLRRLYGTMDNADLCRLHFPDVRPQGLGYRARRLGLRSKEFSWTKQEDRLLRLWYGRMTNRELAARYLPRRTPVAVESRGRIFGLARHAEKPWTMRELRLLRRHYPTNSIHAVKRFLPDRTANAIHTRVALAGLQKMPVSPQWNTTEDSLIRRHYERKNGLQLLTRKLSGRTRLSIQQRARKLGLSLNGEPWTVQEEKLLRRLFAKHGYAASIPNRTRDSVRGRAQKLGLHSLPSAPPGSRRGLDWSKEELRILRASRNLSPKALVAVLPGRAYRAIIGKRFVLGIGRRAGSGARSAWSAREESILKRHAGAHARDLLPLLPGRTYESIRTRLSKRG